MQTDNQHTKDHRANFYGAYHHLRASRGPEFDFTEHLGEAWPQMIGTDLLDMVQRRQHAMLNRGENVLFVSVRYKDCHFDWLRQLHARRTQRAKIQAHKAPDAGLLCTNQNSATNQDAATALIEPPEWKLARPPALRLCTLRNTCSIWPDGGKGVWQIIGFDNVDTEQELYILRRVMPAVLGGPTGEEIKVWRLTHEMGGLRVWMQDVEDARYCSPR